MSPLLDGSGSQGWHSLTLMGRRVPTAGGDHGLGPARAVPSRRPLIATSGRIITCITPMSGRPLIGIMCVRALHLTGVVLVMASPGAGSAGAVDAGRVPGRSGRPWRRLAWLVSFDQLLVADRVVTDGELEHSQEDQAAAA